VRCMLFLRNKIVSMPTPTPIKKQRGVVLIVALFIVALVAAMAYTMMARLERDTRRTTLLLRNVEAEYYAQGSIAWARDQLHNDWEKQKPNQMIDRTPIYSPIITVNGYRITSVIYDMQARFNINSLTTPEAQASFKQLLKTIHPDLTEEKRNRLTANIVNWIMPGSTESEANKYYFSQSTPYRAANKPLLHASEIRLVKDMTPALYLALEPYITALPSTVTQINIQSASAPVLAILSPTMTLATGRMLEKIRAQTPFISTQQFLNIDIVKTRNISADKITVMSAYFLVETKVTIEKQTLVLYTLLERVTQAATQSSSNNKVMVTLLWQSKGIP